MACRMGYRQSHVITYAAGAGTNYQIKILVYSGAGTSSAGSVYCKNHCASFPNDINFTDDTGNTALKYWIEDPTVNPVVVWVKVTGDLTTVDKTIYIYYGKPGQSSLVDGDNTFLFYDHFLGTILDTNKWAKTTVEGAVDTVVSNSECQVTNSVNSSSWWDCLYGKTSVGPYNIRAKFRGKFIDYYCYEGLGVALTAPPYNLNRAAFYVAVSSTTEWTANGTANTNPSITFSAGYSLKEILWTSGHVVYLENGTSLRDETTYTPIAAMPFSVGVYNYATSRGTLDWCFLSKYVNPEPANSTWGSEELPTLTTGKIFVIDKSNNLFRVDISGMTEEKALSIS
jgi:hypothetical protein